MVLRTVRRTIAQNLSLADIKARVKATQADKPKEPKMAALLDEAYKRIKKSKALNDPKNAKALQAIIEQMEKLLEPEG